MKDIIQIILLLSVIGILLKQSVPYSKLAPKRQRRLILDTCGLIDGRLLQLAKSGFVPEELIIPEFVLHELQMLADGADAHKRERARFGLDVVKELQNEQDITVTIDTTHFERQPNDDKLVELAQKLNAPLYTTDFNLNKLADIKSVKVLNVNELAQNLRSVALPGEKCLVKILQKGSNPKQGVGYLDDGTMVVVDGAAKLIGKSMEVEITRVHQTVAGKMLFAEVSNPKDVLPVEHTPTRQKPKITSVAQRFRRPRSIKRIIS